MSPKLDRRLVKEISGKSSQDFTKVKNLDASKRSLVEVSELTFLSSLAKLDVSHNGIEDMSGLTSCTSLRWLNLSSNKLTTVEALSGLPHLQVLNISHNQIAGKLRLKGFPGLCALIANDNAITILKGLGEAAKLNTLVLRNNRISTLGKALAPCTALAKLSVAHNQLSDIGDSLSTCIQLAELRIGHNNISQLPSSLAKNTRLKIVELGGNSVEATSAIEVLRKLPHLASCSLKGCPLANAPNYQQQMQTLLPSLRILDGQKKSHSQQASAEQSLLQEPAKAKKRTANLSELEVEAKEASQEAGGKKAAKKRRVTFAEQREEPLQTLGEPSGRELEPKERSKKKAKHEKKRKKVDGASSQATQLTEGIKDSPLVAVPRQDVLRSFDGHESLSTRRQDVEQDVGKVKMSLHGKHGGKGAEIGAALQQGLLGTVMRPEEALAPGWD